jgi:hypothetical protein
VRSVSPTLIGRKQYPILRPTRERNFDSHRTLCRQLAAIIIGILETDALESLSIGASIVIEISEAAPNVLGCLHGRSEASEVSPSYLYWL